MQNASQRDRCQPAFYCVIAFTSPLKRPSASFFVIVSTFFPADLYGFNAAGFTGCLPFGRLMFRSVACKLEV